MDGLSSHEADERGPVRAAAVVLAAGSGSRLGAQTNKVLLDLDGVPILAHSLRTAASVPGVQRVVLVARPGDELTEVARHLGDTEVWVVDGGSSRQESELAALAVLRPLVTDGSVEVIALHDAARPLASAELWQRVLAAASSRGGAIPVRPLPGLVGPGSEEGLVGVQTPQAFRAADLIAAYDAVAGSDHEYTDTAAAVGAHSDLVVVAVPGEARNLKVTFPGDVEMAEALLG